MRVSTIDDDVSLLEERFELSNEVVDSVPGLDEQNDLSGALEVGTKILNGLGSNDGLS